MTPYKLKGNELYPLVYAGDAVVPGTPSNVTGYNLSFLALLGLVISIATFLRSDI